MLIHGPHVHFTTLDQIFTRIPEQECDDIFEIYLEMSAGIMALEFARKLESTLDINGAIYELNIWNFSSRDRLALYPGMPSHEIESQLPHVTRLTAKSKAAEQEELEKLAPDILQDVLGEGLRERVESWSSSPPSWIVKRNRCFLRASLSSSPYSKDIDQVDPSSLPACDFRSAIAGVIHVPAFRKRTSRNHPIPETSNEFPQIYPGTFEDYTAAVVAKWETDGDERLDRLIKSLQELNLTSGVSTHKLNDVELELRVARPGWESPTGTPEMVSLADVGVGVSYVLPVLVALEVALHGQTVYIEQPESHLHPRAAYGLAKALARAANRGVRVIVETHSSLLLLHIQTLVACGELKPESVGLHWFSLDEEGFTTIDFVQPDEHGRVGEWPEDFADVELSAQSQFLRAARAR